MYRYNSRVEVSISGGNVHRHEPIHEPRSVISGNILGLKKQRDIQRKKGIEEEEKYDRSTSSNGVGFEQTIGEDWQKLKSLGQNKLPARRRIGAVLSVDGENSANLLNEIFANGFGRGNEARSSGQFGHVVDERVVLA